LAVAALLLTVASVQAQDRRLNRILLKPDSEYMVYKPHRDTPVRARDLFDVFNSVFHKNHPKVIKKDTITTKPTFSYIPAVGYTLETEFIISLTGNVAFRTDSQARISTITTNIGYSQNKQFTFPIESEIWTKNNSFDLVGDYRFYKYPQSTFGLGSNSNIKSEDPMDYIYVRFHEVALKNIVGNLFIGAGYIIDYHGNISHKEPIDGAPSDYTAYGPDGHTISSGITAQILFDSRDNSIYPSDGTYTSLQYRDNFTFLGSTDNWRSVIIDLRKYFRFPASSTNVLAFWNYDWLTVGGKPPYLDLPSTGWDPYASTGRGYIQGRFRGAQEVYAEAEYRFKLTANGLFGGVAFANAASFSAAPGTKLESIQPGYGTGLRIKLNKVSKTNIDIDYGFGREGSRGLFVNVGELF
jgi:outer membrane protein assembly factor BamA